MTAFGKIREDLNAVLARDPAARSRTQVILTYGGFHALCIYRFAHFLYVHRYRLLARIISRLCAFITGVEIHPAAVIGYGVVIDHGYGVVIGETAVVGNYVTIYQGVTLGGTGKQRGKRHPTVCDNVTVSCGAKILGGFTVGKGAKIGAGSVVLHEVPPQATVVGIPGRIVKLGGEKTSFPDPIADEINELKARIAALENAVMLQASYSTKTPDKR